MTTAPLIDPAARIHPNASIGSNTHIGPWCFIGEDVVIGDNCVIEPNVVIKGPTVIGNHNHIYQFSSVGESTPDMKYKGEKTRLVIGDHNIIREGVTLHRGTIQDRAETTIGDHNLLMAYVHVGHDSVIGNHCILVNNSALAGHVIIGDWAILSGYTLVHQHCHIGAHSFTGMGSTIGKDVPAFVLVAGNPAAAKSINSEGLMRRGYSKAEVSTINKAFKVLYRRGLTLVEALKELQKMREDCEPLTLLIDSLNTSSRGIVR